MMTGRTNTTWLRVGSSLLAMVLAAPAMAQAAAGTGPATGQAAAPVVGADAATTTGQATAAAAADMPAGDIVVTGTTTRAVSQVSGAEIQKILPGISPLKAPQTLPGVTYLTADPWGNNEQNISLFIHGFNQQQLGYTLDGLPLGDQQYGNYNGLLVMPWTFRPENQFLAADFRSTSGPEAPTPAGSVAEIRAYLATGIDGFFTVDPALGRMAVDG